MAGAISEGGAARGLAPTDNSRLREQIDLFCERAILGLVLAILVWTPLAMGTVRLIDFVPVEVMTALALGFWVARFWTQRPFRLFWPPVCWAVYAFLVYAVARCRIVEIPFLAQREMMHVIVYGILFFVVANNLNRRESAEIVTIALVILGAALSLFAIYQFSVHSARVNWVPWELKPALYLRRGSGTFINPDNFGGYVAMLIPLALAYVMVSRMSVIAKVLLGYGALMLLAGLCVSVSKGAILAAAAACVLMCVALLFQGSHTLAAALALVVMAAGAIGVWDNVESLSRRFDKTNYQQDDRRLYWKIADKVFENHKVWGAGPAHFDQQFYLYRPPELRSAIVYAHDDYLNTLADWGAVGLAIIAAALGTLAFGAWRAWRSVRRFADIGSRRSDKGAFVVGAFFGLVAVALHCLVDFDLHIPANAILAVVLMALLAAHQRFATEGHWKNPGQVGKLLLTLVGLATAAWLGIESWHLGREQVWMQRAYAEKRIIDRPVDPDRPDYEAVVNSPERRAAFDGWADALQHAYRLDPTDWNASFNLGEYHWGIADQGDKGYQAQTFEAMRWYSKAIMANPLNSLGWVQYGVCLDWLDRHQEADLYFRRAHELDPNGWYTAFCIGRHLVDMGRLEEAKKSFEFAYNWIWWPPDIAQYIKMVDERLREAGKK